MRTPLERIRLGAVFLGIIVTIAVVGYHWAGYPWTEAIWMVVVTIASVGFGEHSQQSPAMQMFTVGVIIFGMSATAYTIGGFLQMMTEGEIERALGRRRMSHEIDKLKNHVIICGFGRIGQLLAGNLRHKKLTFVVIDNDPERILEAQDADCLCLTGDATEDDILITAGVERAKTLVTGLPNDAANVFITLTSRNLNSEIQIISRAEHETTKKKLRQAGANKVVMPAIIGAQQMARLITRPSTADLMELVAETSYLDAELDEIEIPANNPLVGVSVCETESLRHNHLLIVAIKQSDDSMVFNPDVDYIFAAGDIVILMGKVENIDSFRKEFGL